MNTLLKSLLLFSSCIASAHAVEKTDLFEAGKDGYALYRIPGIVVTKQGTVLAYCEARKSDRGDWGPIDVLMRRSTDGGKTWGPRQKIVHVEGDLPINPLAAAQNLDKPGDNTVNNPVAIVDHETGAVHFLYCLEYMRCFSMRSDDDGATWTKPVEITKTFEDFRSDYDWKVLATGPSHAIQLTHGPKRGRLVVPVWLSLGTGGHAHRPSVTATIYSDDHGRTWQRGDIAVPDTPEFIYPNETVVVQLADGRVMLNSRSESKAHRRLVTISPDGATNWSRPRFDEQLLEPICMAGMVRVRMPNGDQPGVIAFSNPYNLSRADGKETPGKSRDRRNVTIKLSDDEGQTWSASRTLEEGFSGYSDLAALPDGTILCFYERGSTDGKNHYRTGLLTVARLTEDWVRDGIEADVCVYGGTSGGVAAAVQAARMGKRVVLLEPGRHLGGMTSGGLSAVDIGEPRSVGGIAREYFSRLVASYGKTLNWNQPFRGKGGPATGGAYSIEPHVAERVFEEMVREAGVTVLRDARLASVIKKDARITELKTADGRTVRAKMFLDTTYEGDLLAAAGVSYTVMREGNAKYGETYNGIHYAEKYKPRINHRKPGANGRVPGGQGVWDRDFPLDPYVVKGDPASGLLPLVSEGEPGKPGDPAPGVMAYCFRLCLSTADDRLPIQPPPDYDPNTYELVARFIEACREIGDDMDLRWFSKHDPLPNQKWDFNTATFGGNLPGVSWEWPEASYDRRAEIAKEIENYHRGLLHFLATDPRVPDKVRTDVARFGLPRDEFTDNGGWPHQIYVREGRRMVSDLVFTEHHTFGRKMASDSIGLGSYGTDIHEIRRIVKDGVVIREGKVAGGRGGFGPYQIGYGSIVPKQSECENLFATFALSASHPAFASIRMEPVFMVTSQSAATAASLAIEQEVAVQKVDYEKLKTRLLADGQVLSWPPAGVTTTAAVPRTIVRADSLPGIVLDDDEAEYQGDWTTSNRQPSPIGDSYRHDGNKGRGERSATFTATIPKAGEYEIRFLFTRHENRSSRTKVTVTGAGEERTFRINQREPSMKDRVPNSLGVFRFEACAKARVTVSNEGANGYVVVDGLQILPIDLAREERKGKRPSGYAEVEMAAKPVSSDVVIYGATPAGIAAALSAADGHRSVLLIEPTSRIGGMTTHGLSHSDFHSFEALHGPFLKFSQRVLEYYETTYGKESEQVRDCWRGTHGEPSVNLLIFQQMLAEKPSIRVLTEHRIARVSVEDHSITTLIFSNSSGGSVAITPGVVIDASYEGDLLAAAGVPYRVGREARFEYDESLAPEEADDQVQGYNFRLCMTQDPKNRVPVPVPKNYDRDEYATLVPLVREGKFRSAFGYPGTPFVLKAHLPALPNGKRDINDVSKGLVRLSLPGRNHHYPEGDLATRRRIEQEHLDWQLGLIHFVQADPALPEAFRKEAATWGLCRDEFADTNHIPPQIYVREARRMVGLRVYTEADTEYAPNDARSRLHPDSIAVGEYSHNCHGTNHEGPQIGGRHTGEFYKGVAPYQIPYGVIVPKRMGNLLVPTACSASHVGFCAIRLEPIWMSLGGAAGHAARMALQANIPVQQVDAGALQKRIWSQGGATIHVSDVPPGHPDFAAVQWWAGLGGLHGVEPAPAKPGTRGQHIVSQYFEAFPGHAAKLDQPLDDTLTKRWTTLAKQIGLPVPVESTTRGDWIRTAFAASTKRSAEEAVQGFVSLCDGKSFAGWEHKGNWEIHQGAFARVRPGGALTYTAAMVPDDFELRFEWKVSKGCNSGVYYRPAQYEYQILDNVHSPYGDNPRQAAGSLFFCMAPSKDATKPFGQWNSGRIKCKGTVIEHWVNGERVLSFDYTDPKWADMVKLLKIRGADLTARGGRLWLQDHGQDVWFRRLRWREIPSDEPVAADPDFVPLPVMGEALKKEQQRVRRMLEAQHKKP